MSEETPLNAYEQLIACFTVEEMDLIVRLKRFFEWVQGDQEFAAAAGSGSFSQEQRARLQQIGVTFDLRELDLLWENSDFQLNFLRACGCQDAMPAELLEKIAHRPLLALWTRYVAQKNKVYRHFRSTVFRVPKNPRFDAWRMRRVAAAKSELGHFGHVIDHPILAFELGDGCSVGCWFCAFAARKLTTNFDYLENREFFQDVVKACADVFGRDQAAMALLYYGTEPHDNPHYLDFLKDFAKITGHASCTSTAVPGDAEWVRSLIAFYRQGNLPWPRFSVLTKKMLLKIHELYTPDELRDVELLIQTREHPRQKVTGGRILAEQNGMRDRESGHYMDQIVPQGSIACVSGFLINMVHKTIQLVSPCYTSKKWAYGYRIYDTAAFTDALDFPRAIEELIERNMPLTPRPDSVVRFRDDLCFKPTEQGFDLISPNQVHHFAGKEVVAPLGAMIAEGNQRVDQMYSTMTDTLRINPMLTGMAVKQLFDGGFLDEVRAV